MQHILFVDKKDDRHQNSTERHLNEKGREREKEFTEQIQIQLMTK